MSRSAMSARSVAAVLAAQAPLGGGDAPSPDMSIPARPRAPAGRERPFGSRISARLGLLTARLAATASAAFARIGLGSVEAKVLFALGSGPQSSSAVGRVMGLDRAAVCRAARSLEARGLVGKADGAGRRLALTGEGAAALTQVDILAHERERRLLAGFSEAEQAIVLSLLGRLMLNVPDLDTLAEFHEFDAPADL